MAKLGETVGGNPLDLFCLNRVSGQDDAHRRIMISGISNDGKTTTAATASEYCPEILPTNKPVVLEDMQWILLDGDGLSGFRALGLHVDHLDLSNAPASKLQGILRAAIDKCAELAITGKKRWVVFDTGSTLDCQLQAAIKMDADTSDSKFGFWDAVLTAHTKVFSQLRSLPCNVLFLVHVKPIIVVGDDNQQAIAQTKLASEGLKEGDLAIDISGKAARYYRNNFGLILPVRGVGKAPNREFFLYPYGVAGLEAKCKYTHLDKQEPANLRRLLLKCDQAERK